MHEDKPAKVKHVKNSKQTRKHACHWPDCPKQVAPAMWGCYPHWLRLPIRLRDKIWDAYRVKQEADGTPSKEYVKAAQDVQEWIIANLWEVPRPEGVDVPEA